MRLRKIPCSEEYDFCRNLGSAVKIREWRVCGLPNDDFSAENGVIATRGARWPLMIDPQGQANKWIKMFEARNRLNVVSCRSSKMLSVLERSVSNGSPLLIEDIGESVDPVLDSVLYRRTYVRGGRTVIRIGDNVCEYCPTFRLYMTTSVGNPKYLPDVFIRTAVLNFSVTKFGLEEQLLADVVKIEDPDVEKKYSLLVVSIASDKKQLQAIEDSILHDLHNAEGHLLDNEKLVNSLSESKLMSKMVLERLAESEATEKKIMRTREQYRSVARRGSLMYFLIIDLVYVDPM